MILFVSSGAYADIYVITDKNGDIYTISEKNDTVVPEGYTIESLPGKIEDFALTQQPDEYKFKNKKFSIDTKRVSDKRKKEAESQAEVESRKSARESGVEKLKAIGLTDSEINALIRG